MIKILLVIVLILLGFVSGLYVDDIRFTGKTVIENKHAWTKAICNENNECIDILIECENGNVKSITPVSDLKRFDVNWIDIRNKTGKLC